MNQCKAIKKDGNRCDYQAKYSGFCGIHFPKPRKKGSSNLATKGKKVLEGAALAGGVIELINHLVELWQNYPLFGNGPKMPMDYNYLVDNFGFSYPKDFSDDSYKPGTYGAESINWALARKVFDSSRRFKELLEHGKIDDLNFDSEYKSIETDTIKLIDDMESNLKEVLLMYLGRNEVE